MAHGKSRSPTDRKVKCCPQCGTHLDTDAVFCGSCGRRQPTAPRPIPQTIIRPPPMSSPSPAASPPASTSPSPPASAPPSPASTPPAPPSTPPASERKTGRGGLIALLVSLGVLTLGGGGAALYVFVLRDAGSGAVASKRTVLLSKEVSPSAQEQRHGVDDVAVLLPAGFSDKTERLVLARVEVTGQGAPTSGRAYEVELGSQRRLRSPIEIAFTYPKPAKAPHCVASSDGGKSWAPVPCVGDPATGKVIVTTDHLSLFAVDTPQPPEPGPMMRAGRIRYPSGSFMADEQVESILRRAGNIRGAKGGWSAAMEWFGLGSAASAVAQHACASTR
jgi:hypothetical protein